MGDRGRERGKPTLIYPLRDLLGFAVWVASYMGSTMRYHGGAYSLGVGGRFEPVETEVISDW